MMLIEPGHAGCKREGERSGLVGELEVADVGVVDLLGAGAVVAHVVGGPPQTEVVRACGELADEPGQGLVVRVPAGLGAEGGDDAAGALLPRGVEDAGRRVEEGEEGVVAAAGGIVEDGRQEGAPERVGGDDVHLPVAHPGRGAGDGVEEALEARSDC